MDTPKRYWFPAKQFGWGWGLPTCWQGWAVFAAYLVVVALVIRCVPPATDHVRFVAGIAVSTAILLAVCWLKGEPPGSRRT